MNVLRTRFLLLLIVLILTAVCLSVPCYFIYMNAKGVIVDELGNNAIDIAAAVAAFIERDIDKYNELPVQNFSLPADTEQPGASATPGADYTETPKASSSGGSITSEDIAAEPSDTQADTSAYNAGYNDGYNAGYADGYGGYDYVYAAGTYEDNTYDNGYGDGYDDGYADGACDSAYYSDTGDGSADTGTPEVGSADDVDYGTSNDGSSDTGTADDADSLTLKGGKVSVHSSTDTLPHVPVFNPYNEHYFNEIIGLLEKIQRETGAAKIYTEKKLSDTKKGYVFRENYVPENRFLSSDIAQEELLAFNEGVKASTNILKDASLGEYIKGYAPIVDIKTNKPVGVVVVEFALADAVKLTSEVLILIISCFVALTFLATAVIHRLYLSRMKYLSKDVLTELGNKRFFESSLKKEIKFARGLKRPLALMMIDVDMFKNINDRLGHMTGDMVLKAVSGVLLKCTRRVDVCCRYGGDEFSVMLPNTDRMQAAAIAERIRQEVCALRFESDSGEFGVTLSIGVAELGSDMTADMFKKITDKTLYYSKNTGKNRITVYNNAQNISI